MHRHASLLGHVHRHLHVALLVVGPPRRSQLWGLGVGLVGGAGQRLLGQRRDALLLLAVFHRLTLIQGPADGVRLAVHCVPVTFLRERRVGGRARLGRDLAPVAICVGIGAAAADGGGVDRAHGRTVPVLVVPLQPVCGRLPRAMSPAFERPAVAVRVGVAVVVAVGVGHGYLWASLGGAGARVAALQAVGAQQTPHTVVRVVLLFISLNSVGMCVHAGLDPSHVAVLGRSAQVFRKGGDWDVIGQLRGFYCAHLINEKTQRFQLMKIKKNLAHP